MLGTGLIGMFYTKTLHDHRGIDRVHHVYSRSLERAKEFASEWNIPKYTDNLASAINDPDTDIVVIGLPNNLHRKAIMMAADAGKAIFCTKPLAMNGKEALEILEYVEHKGVFHGYLEIGRTNRLDFTSGQFDIIFLSDKQTIKPKTKEF